MPDGEGLLALDMLPPASNTAIKDLVFFYKVFYGYIDINITNTQWLSYGNCTSTCICYSYGILTKLIRVKQ